MDNKIKHLEMIEAIIERMARNSFQLKGWAMTLVAAICALAAQDSDLRFIYFALIPIVGFCGLDAYYLQQERKYKELYKQVVAKKNDEIDFSLDTSTITSNNCSRVGYFRCLGSMSIWLFYGSIGAAVLVIIKLLSKPPVRQ